MSDISDGVDKPLSLHGRLDFEIIICVLECIHGNGSSVAVLTLNPLYITHIFINEDDPSLKLVYSDI